MASLRTEIYSILSTDAQATGAGQLGNSALLGRPSTDPNGVYFKNPPDGFDLTDNPVLVFAYPTMVGREPVDIFLTLTAYGDKFERVESVLNRSRTLLHHVNLDTTDWQVLDMAWDFAGPDSFDEFLRTYFWEHRYLIKAYRK